MRRVDRFRLAASLGVLIYAAPLISAADEGHHGDTPLAKTEGRRYPSGAAVQQVVSTPDETVNLAEPGAGLAESPLAEGPAVSSAAAIRGAARVVGTRAATERFQLLPLYSTRIGTAAPGVAPPVGAEAAAVAQAQFDAGEPQETAKFVVSFDLSYKGVPLARPSSSTTLFGPGGKVLFVRDRNLPGDEEIHTRPDVARDAALDVGREDVKKA